MYFDEYICPWPGAESKYRTFPSSPNLIPCSLPANFCPVLATTVLIYILRIPFVCSWSSYKWDHTEQFPFCLASWINLFLWFIYVAACISSSLIFIADQCSMIRLQTVHPSPCWWKFGLFSIWSYYKWRCYKQSCTSGFWTFVFISLGQIPRSEASGSQGSCVLTAVRKC